MYLPGKSDIDLSFINSDVSSGSRWNCPFGFALRVANLAIKMLPAEEENAWILTIKLYVIESFCQYIDGACR